MVSSFFNKLKNECYDDKSFNVMNLWVNSPNEYPKSAVMRKNIGGMYIKTTLNMIPLCSTINLKESHIIININFTIEKNLELIKGENKFFVRLEDLVTDEEKLQSMISFLGLDYNSSLLEILKKPHNVNVPVNFSLSEEQNKSFFKIAGKMMSNYGYNRDEEL